jgi:hypothetical protein
MICVWIPDTKNENIGKLAVLEKYFSNNREKITLRGGLKRCYARYAGNLLKTKKPLQLALAVALYYRFR